MFAKIMTNIIPWVYSNGDNYYRKYSGYNGGAYNYNYGHNVEPDVAWLIFVMWILLIGFLIWFLHRYWDEIVAYYYKWHERGRVKSVTVDLYGNVSNLEKMEQLTEDVNAILAGQRLPQISRAHKLSAENIIGISVIPGEFSLLYTIWYK